MASRLINMAETSQLQPIGPQSPPASTRGINPGESVLDEKRLPAHSECKNCGIEFPPKLGQVHCSEKCRKIYHKSGSLSIKQRRIMLAIVREEFARLGLTEEKLRQHGLIGAK